MTEDKRNMLSADSRFAISFLLEDSPQGSTQKPDKILYQPSIDELSIHENRFGEYSSEAANEFMAAAEKIIPLVSAEEFGQWSKFGIRLLEISNNELALVQAFFDSSEAVCVKTSFTYLKGWFEKGLDVARLSLATATTYYELTRLYIQFSNNIQLQKWADWCIHLMDRSKPQNRLGMIFLEHSIACLKFMTFREFREYKNIGFMFFRISTELGKQFFEEVAQGLNDLDVTQRRTLYQLTKRISRHNENEAIDFFRYYPKELVKVSPNERNSALRIIEKLSKTNPEKIPALFNHLVLSLNGQPHPRQILILNECERILRVSKNAGCTFLLNVREILSQIPDCFLGQFVDVGIDLHAVDISKTEKYFSLTAKTAIRELAKWHSAALLEDHHKTLSILASAMTGKIIEIKNMQPSETVEEINPEVCSSTDGKNIYLPWQMAGAGSLEKNFTQYKITAAHLAGLIEFHTFSSDLSVMVKMMEDLPQNSLALDIFFILEHGRIDFQLARNYVGLRDGMENAIAQALKQRSHPEMLPLKEAMVEVLLLYSVKPFNPAYLKITNKPSKIFPSHITYMDQMLSGFYENYNSVWCCFEKTYEIYHYLKSLPNKKKGRAEESYHPCQPLTFRGGIHLPALKGQPQPEIMTIDTDEISMDKDLKEKETGQIELLKHQPDRIKLIRGMVEAGSGMVTSNKDVSAMMSDTQEPDDDNSNKLSIKFQDIGGATATAVQSDGCYFYDEWDYIQAAYRKKWCCIKEIRLEEGNLDKILDIYSQNRNLIKKVKKQFQQIKPRVYESIPRVDWGEEIDLAAVIEGVVDKKAGNMPSDKVFIRKERKKQSLSVLLLADMSASTGNSITFNDSELPNHESKGNVEKKIIDVEIESLVIVMEALESLSNEYALYGFSGYGREEVNVYSIKDFNDSYGDSLKKRIGGMEAQKSTRMGAAIRHASSILEKQETEQRLLILLSDGFPQDYDYGEDRSSYEYGVYDTMMALMEAKLKDIRTFCITVDHDGKDYLKNMCEPSSYLVIRDIFSLPEMLPKVVASLIY